MRADDDGRYADRQLTGLRALIALAEPEATVVPFSGPSVRLRYTGPFEQAYAPPLQPPGQTGAAGGSVDSGRSCVATRCCTTRYISS